MASIAAEPSIYAGRDLVRKTPLLAPFIYKRDHFTKTGSGQTREKLRKEWRFSQAFGSLPPADTYLLSAVRAVADAATGRGGIPAANTLKVGFVWSRPNLAPMRQVRKPPF